MPAINIYPDPFAARSVFMFGLFDMDAAVPESAAALGEAILASEKPSPAILALFHQHRHAAATGPNGAFMFGINAEQPALTVPNEDIMGLWPGEQT